MSLARPLPAERPPKCELCPVAEDCQARRQNRTGELPVLAKKSARRVVQKTVFALTMDGLPLGYRRAEKGLLAGLWQLPDTAGWLTDAEAALWMGERGILPVGELRFFERKHIFTHIEWHMRVCSAEVSAKTLPRAGLSRQRHALPTQQGCL